MCRAKIIEEVDPSETLGVRGDKTKVFRPKPQAVLDVRAATQSIISFLKCLSATSTNNNIPDITTEDIFSRLIAKILVALIVAGLRYFLSQQNKSRKSSKNNGTRSRKDGRGADLSHPYVQTVSIPARPIHPEISSNYTVIDMLEPPPSSSSVMHEIPISLSPPRPSLPPLNISPLSITPPAIRYIAKVPSIAPTAFPAVEHNSNNPASAVSIDDAASENSMAAYSQTSTSTRIHKAWKNDTEIPPIT